MTIPPTVALTRVVVLAKAPVPGRSKTRLTPTYTPQQAASIAHACLLDTLETVRTLAAAEPGWDVVVCLEGDPGSWLSPDVPVVRQRRGGHDARIAGGFEDCVGGPGLAPADAVLLIGMDTPHLTADHLRAGRDVVRPGCAALGPAFDGGWWLLGLPATAAAAATELILGVPTSTPQTGDLQAGRLRRHGLRVRRLPLVRDIDTAWDLRAVVAEMGVRQAPSSLVRAAEQLRAESAA
jgi:glycosyltransferase A (GT-A) superfamily protein (DUF2064 family)